MTAQLDSVRKGNAAKAAGGLKQADSGRPSVDNS